VLHRGRDGDYRALAWTGGEPHRTRRDLVGAAWEPPRRGVRALACLAHVTDLQLADVRSPARFEFFHRFEADPRMRAPVPTHRPQEALTAHAVDALVRTLDGLAGAPRTGEPLQVVLTPATPSTTPGATSRSSSSPSCAAGWCPRARG
jgi:hypothetical protein